MSLKLRTWDSARLLETEADRDLFLQSAVDIGQGDTAFIGRALYAILRARAVHQLVADSGLPVDQVFRLLNGDGPPALADLQQLARAMGLRLTTPQA